MSENKIESGKSGSARSPLCAHQCEQSMPDLPDLILIWIHNRPNRPKARSDAIMITIPTAPILDPDDTPTGEQIKTLKLLAVAQVAAAVAGDDHRLRAFLPGPYPRDLALDVHTLAGLCGCLLLALVGPDPGAQERVLHTCREGREAPQRFVGTPLRTAKRGLPRSGSFGDFGGDCWHE